MFFQLDSIALDNFDEEHEQTSDTSENIDLFVQKISESGLINYQDNTTTHIGDLITEKAKEPKKFRCGFIWIRKK